MRFLTSLVYDSKICLFLLQKKCCNVFVKSNNKRLIHSIVYYNSSELINRNRHDKYCWNTLPLHFRQCSFQNENENQYKWLQPPGTNSGINVYNCVAKKKVPLFIKNGVVTWYSCGPTVYDSAHIGHASCYVKLDIIQRILRNYFQLNLITCMGVTDIDDKIIQKSIDTGVSIDEITKTYEAEFWKNLSDLFVIMPDFVVRVTDHIPIIINFVRKIMDKNLCYVAPDKSIYFDTENYGKYGKLQKAQQNTDVEDMIVKKSSSDFALWKSYKEGEPFWDTEWGKGRPGWHIECSAMASHLFGNTIDFHAGGIDLQFPHHENEEAQSCAFHNNQQWVNYWIHTGHLHLKNDVKMSKSLKNTISINELLKKCNANIFRMTCLMSHYRYSMEFSDDVIENAKNVLLKIKQFLADSNVYVKYDSFHNFDAEKKLLESLTTTKFSVDAALRDDFDTPKCIALIIKMMTDTNKIMISKDKHNFSPVAVASVSKFIIDLIDIFGINLNRKDSGLENSNLIDATVNFRKYVRTRALEMKDRDLLNECDILRNTYAVNKIKINDKKNNEASWIYEE